MSKAKTPLTQSAINKLSCPPGRKSVQYPIDPIHIPGLLVEVRHTGSKSYFLRYRDADQSTRYCKLARLTDASLSDVKKKALQIRREIFLGNYPGADKATNQQCMTFSEFFEQKYLPFAKPRKRSWRDDEKLYNRRLKALFGDTPLDKITRHSLQQMHSDLRATLSASSCDHNLGLMARCLRLASDWKILITENPAQGLKKYNEDNRRDRLMTDDELQRLMAVLDSDSARTACLVIKWCLYTACRKGEALHLRWADINRDTNTWTIQAANAKSKKRRFVPLNSVAIAILDELTEGNTSEWVFLNSRNGERLKSADTIWRRVHESAGLPPDIVWHSTRHMGASMMLASGADLATVRDILGHADISTTEKYLHASGKSLRSGAAGIEAYLEKALAKKAS
jgi:integrase